jgi:hypothetical protein
MLQLESNHHVQVITFFVLKAKFLHMLQFPQFRQFSSYWRSPRMLLSATANDFGGLQHLGLVGGSGGPSE